MIGAIVGDIVGSRFEMKNCKSYDFDLFDKWCSFTDDTVMTLAVAKTIMSCGGNYERLSEMAIKNMKAIGRAYPDCGFGGMFESWIFSSSSEPYNSFGNGAAMRVSPCGWVAKTEEDAKILSRRVTEITHNHPEGIKGAEATTLAIFMCRNGASKAEVKERIESDYYILDFTVDDLVKNYRFDGSCQGTVPQAVFAFLESKSFEDTIRIAISFGGDSDTLAAIAGSIAEAYYGVDEHIEKEAITYLDTGMLKVYCKWKLLSSSRRSQEE